MSVPSPRAVERTLISDVLGWSVVEDPDEAGDFPSAFWSPDEGCYKLLRLEGEDPERFTPTRSFHDVWDVCQVLSESSFEPRLARPVDRGNVRVVVDLGRKEVVAEARSMARALSMAIYQAVDERLI